MRRSLLGVSLPFLLFACQALDSKNAMGDKICSHPDGEHTLLLSWDKWANQVSLGGQPRTDSDEIIWGDTGFKYTYNQGTVFCITEGGEHSGCYDTVKKKTYLGDWSNAEAMTLTYWPEYGYPPVGVAEGDEERVKKEILRLSGNKETIWQCDKDAGFLDILVTEFLSSW